MGANLSQFVWCVSTSIALVFAAILLSDERKSADAGNYDDSISKKAAESNEVASNNVCCASCGISTVKLKKCKACNLVRYCNVVCQKNHRLQHKRACKKRAAELRDELLFKQPESAHQGDCPICLLPMPLDVGKIQMKSCCSILICKGCVLANYLREEEQGIESTCAFCRTVVPKTSAECKLNRTKRIEKNDPAAMREEGGRRVAEKDFGRALELWTKAAEQGDADAHYQLSIMKYFDARAVKNTKKELYHMEEAAIRGHPDARYNLGCHERRNGRSERAVKHFFIAAKLGCDHSTQALKRCYVGGDVSKEDFAAALRAHQAAVDATKSLQREAAELHVVAKDHFWFKI